MFTMFYFSSDKNDKKIDDMIWLKTSATASVMLLFCRRNPFFFDDGVDTRSRDFGRKSD